MIQSKECCHRLARYSLEGGIATQQIKSTSLVIIVWTEFYTTKTKRISVK